MSKIHSGRWAMLLMILAGVLCSNQTNAKDVTTSAFDVLPSVGVMNAYSLAATPDDKFLAVTEGNGVDLWDVNKKRRIRHFAGLTSYAKSVSISPDGKWIAAAGDTIIIWDITSGNEVLNVNPFPHVHKSVDDLEAIAFSPDGRRIYFAGSSITVLASRGRVSTIDYIGGILDISSRKTVKILSTPANTANAIDVSADGKVVAIGLANATVEILNSDGQLQRRVGGNSNKVNLVKSLALSPDGKFVAASTDEGRKIQVWSVASGSNVATFTQDGKIKGVTWSPDGQHLAARSDNRLYIWSVGSWKLDKKKDLPNAFLGSARYSFDGKSIFTNTDDALLRIDVESLRYTVLKGLAATLSLIDGQGVAGDDILVHPETAKNSCVIFAFNAESGDFRQVYRGSENCEYGLTSSIDGRKFAVIDGHALFTIDADTKPETRQLKTNLKDYSNASMSADGKHVILAQALNSRSFRIDLIDQSSGSTEKTILGPLGGSTIAPTTVLSPDGKILVTSAGDWTLRQWSVATGSQLAAHKDSVPPFHIVFSPDSGSFLELPFGEIRYLFKYWLTGVSKPPRTYALPRFQSGSMTAAFSPDGKQIVVGTEDGALRTLDLSDGSVIQTFKGHTGSPNGVLFKSNGRRIVSSASHEGIKIWDAQSGQLLITLFLTNDGDWLKITPEGFFDASSVGANALTVVRGMESFSPDQFYQSLYRPDLVREKLAGDPNGKVKAAAAQLDLDKVMASGMAPKVAVTSPASGSASLTDEVAVEATIADQGGGIGKVEWRVNGVTLGLESRGLDRLEAAPGGGTATGRTETVKRTLSLEAGDNKIEVVAYNAKGLIASEPAAVTVKWDGARTASPPKLYVLAVGVNDYYDSRLHLAYAVPDATALADAFRKASTGIYASVEVRTVLDSEVTVANLDKVFADLSTKVQPRDVFVFFLAGHGKTENGRYYFLPRDFRYEDETSIAKAGMGQDKFQAWFAEIPARKSLLLYDTCESGSLTGANARGSDIDERLGALNRMARATGRTFLTATTDDAPALEGFHGHGVFTYALLDAFDHADVNHDGLIEISELADYIDQKVPDYSYQAFKLRQIPQRSIVGNNFALANDTDVLAAAPGTAKTVSIPSKPTHVVVAPADVKDTPSNTAATVMHLAPGTQVRLMQTSGGWVLIARDGQKLGYVQSSALLGLQ